MRKEEFKKTILSQYANSVRMLYLLDRLNNAIDPEIDISNFYRDVFNLDTCGTYGLNVWGRIVAAPRVIRVLSDDFFGFTGSELQPFDNAPFFYGAGSYQGYYLGNEVYRRLIYFKAMVNIMKTDLPSIDYALWKLFEYRAEGDIYAQELTEGVMTMRIIFRFYMTPTERAILRTYGYLLRPGGVGIKLYEIPYETFGFLGSELLPFDQGAFWSGSVGMLTNNNDRYYLEEQYV